MANKTMQISSVLDWLIRDNDFGGYGTQFAYLFVRQENERFVSFLYSYNHKGRFIGLHEEEKQRHFDGMKMERVAQKKYGAINFPYHRP